MTVGGAIWIKAPSWYGTRTESLIVQKFKFIPEQNRLLLYIKLQQYLWDKSTNLPVCIFTVTVK